MTEQKALGMYGFHEGTEPSVKIGKYTICKQAEGRIWIEMDDGEGGEFNEANMAEAIKTFYDANF